MAKSTPHLGDSPEVKTFTGLLDSYTGSPAGKGFEPVKINKSFKVLIYSIVPFICLYVFGFGYNNLQNPSRLFSSAWFYDSLILSWTNLFIIPILFLIVIFGIFRREAWGSDLFLFAFIHLLSPFLWIFGYLIWRVFVKTVESCSNLISDILKYLGDWVLTRSVGLVGDSLFNCLLLNCTAS